LTRGKRPAAAGGGKPSGGQPTRVLLFGGDKKDAASSPLTGALAAAGCALDVAASADQAASALRDDAYDLLVLDLTRPEAAAGLREAATVVVSAENERLSRAVLFARQTAHDLAQPLTTILARAQLLRNRLKPEDPSYRAVSIICDEADRLARMVEEFQKLKEMSRDSRSPLEAEASEAE